MKIEITKTDGHVNLDYTENADIHEVIGLLATTMNYLSYQAQGIDMSKFMKEFLKEG